MITIGSRCAGALLALALLPSLLGAQTLKQLGKGMAQEALLPKTLSAAMERAVIESFEKVSITGRSSKAAQLEKKLSREFRRQAAVAISQQRQAMLLTQLQRGVFVIESQASGLLGNSAGFLFETNYQGNREIWGVTTGLFDPGIQIVARFFKEGKAYDFTGKIVQTGLASPSGIALVSFELTPEFLQTVVALQLASSASVDGTSAVSYGYFLQNQQPVFLPLGFGRVAGSSSRCLISEHKAAPVRGHNMQGGPLLNQHNKVIGLYAGAESRRDLTPAFSRWRLGEPQPVSSPYMNASYAISSSALEELVKAYHQGGISMRPLLWSGSEVSTLDVGERVLRVFTFRDATTWEKAKGEHYLGPHQRGITIISADTWGSSFDETRLESFVDAKDALAVEVWIENYDGELRQVSFLLHNGVPGPVSEGRGEDLLNQSPLLY